MAQEYDEKKAALEEEDNKSGAPPPSTWKHSEEQDIARWDSLKPLLTRLSSKFTPPAFTTEEDNLAMLQEDFRVLVVGAGGLGCEILKNLALSGFKDIELIDLDTIELSNLNRQFLFRKPDVGKAKAKCAAEFVSKRVPGVNIRWYQKPIQKFDSGYYSKFNCVIAGLDNVEARRWLNAMLCSLVQYDDDGNIDPDTVIPLIDGGTEGFLGQCRLFVPMLSACFECSVGTITPPKGFQSCTIASIPRKPEHCIAYAHKMLWNRLKSLKSATDYEMVDIKDKSVNDPCGVQLDTDNVDHMSWIYYRALERAKEFNIEGVSYNMTMQVVKNIIPAIASTNALISAACVNEAFKVLTWASNGLNNYWMYMGQDGIYSRTFLYHKNTQCIVCGSEPQTYIMDGEKNTFKHLYDKICNDPTLKLKKPSVSTADGKPLYMTNKFLRDEYVVNFPKRICDLFESETELQITDPSVLQRRAAKIIIKFESGGEVYVAPVEK